MKEQLNRVMVPVMLGSSAQTLSIARKLYRKYGVISHMYSTHPAWYTYLLSFVRVVRLPVYMQGELLFEDLRSFSEQYPDLLFCLIPCTQEYKAFCMAHAVRLESYYVIMEPEQLAHGSLPYLSAEEMPV
jgi:predicted ATP-grasp superfamily ATP-dependent carboligase